MDKWKFNRKNSKDEIVFKRDTDESLEYVLGILDEEKIPYILKEKATMIRMKASHADYVYYWTTGRWQKCDGKQMKHHYHARGIRYFLDNYFKPFSESGELISRKRINKGPSVNDLRDGREWE